MKSKVYYWLAMLILIINSLGSWCGLLGNLTISQIFMADAVIIVYGALMAASVYYEREEMK